MKACGKASERWRVEESNGRVAVRSFFAHAFGSANAGSLSFLADLVHHTRPQPELGKRVCVITVSKQCTYDAGWGLNFGTFVWEREVSCNVWQLVLSHETLGFKLGFGSFRYYHAACNKKPACYCFAFPMLMWCLKSTKFEDGGGRQC